MEAVSFIVLPITTSLRIIARYGELLCPLTYAWACRGDISLKKGYEDARQYVFTLLDVAEV